MGILSELFIILFAAYAASQVGVGWGIILIVLVVYGVVTGIIRTLKAY